MAQNLDVLLQRESEPAYTRADFTALRAWLSKLPVSQISSLYYDEESLEVLGCSTNAALQRRLERMRDYLADRAIDQNPHVADALRRARLSGSWSKGLSDFLVQAADQDGKPKLSDPVSAWFKTTLAAELKAEGVKTIRDLANLIGLRGDGWYRPIRRLGKHKAAVIVGWLRKFEDTLGPVSMPAMDVVPAGQLVLISPDNPVIVPLERIILPRGLDGAQGFNRNPTYPLVSARNDLEAIDAYLYRFRGKEKTERAYRKELERYLLWCVTVRAKPMSSVQQEDCEAYKDFLANPPAEWIGERAKRMSEGWKPFAGKPSASSQRYAVQAIRTFFAWLVDVRYLAGNPWMTVADPTMATAITPLQIDKALPKALWNKLVVILDFLSAEPDAVLQEKYKLRGAAAYMSMSAQYRLVRAALLLLGESGLRREELAYATRDKLKPVPEMPGLWEMDVLGKRAKWRTVFLPARAIDALKAHWADRGQDFSYELTETPLISPLSIPATKDAQKKHLDNQGKIQDNGFSQDGLYRLIKSALRRIADDELLDLDEIEREILRRASPHAFRHTFGTQAAAGQVPLDVLQRVLGHASLTTTTIYVQAEKQRSIKELGAYFSR